MPTAIALRLQSRPTNVSAADPIGLQQRGRYSCQQNHVESHFELVPRCIQAGRIQLKQQELHPAFASHLEVRLVEDAKEHAVNKVLRKM